MRSEHVLCVPCWRAHKAAAAAARAAAVAAAAAAVGVAPEAASGIAHRAAPQGEGGRGGGRQGSSGDGEGVEVEAMRLFCCLRPEFLYRLRAMCPRPQPADESPGSKQQQQQQHQHQHQHQQPVTVDAPAAADVVMEDDARGGAAPSELTTQPCGSGGAQGAAAQEAEAHAAAAMAATTAVLTAAEAGGCAGGTGAEAWPAASEAGQRLPSHGVPSTSRPAPPHPQPRTRQQQEPPPLQQQQADVVNGPEGGWEGVAGDDNAPLRAAMAQWALAPQQGAVWAADAPVAVVPKAVHLQPRSSEPAGQASAGSLLFAASAQASALAVQQSCDGLQVRPLQQQQQQQQQHHGYQVQSPWQGSTATGAAVRPHAGHPAPGAAAQQWDQQQQHTYTWHHNHYHQLLGQQQQQWQRQHPGYTPEPPVQLQLPRRYPPVPPGHGGHGGITLHPVHRTGGLVLPGGNGSWSGLQHHHHQQWMSSAGHIARPFHAMPCGVQGAQAAALPNALDRWGGQSRAIRGPGATTASVAAELQQQGPQQHQGTPSPPQPVGDGAACHGQEAGSKAQSQAAAPSATVAPPGRTAAVHAKSVSPLCDGSSPCVTEQPALPQHDRNLHSPQLHQPEQQQPQQPAGQRPADQQREDPLFPSSCGPALATPLYNTRITLPGRHMAASLGLPSFRHPHTAAPAAGPAPSKPPTGKGVPAGPAKSAKALQWYDTGAVTDTPEYFAGALVRAAPHCRLGPQGAPGGSASGTSSTSSGSEDLVEEDLCYIIHKERLLQLPPQRKAELVELARDHNGRGGPVVFSGPMERVDDPGGILDEVLGITRKCEEQIARNSREAKQRQDHQQAHQQRQGQRQGQGRGQGQGVVGAGEGAARPTKHKDEGKQAEQRAGTASAGAGEDEDQVRGPFPWLVDGVQWRRDGHLHPREQGVRADTARCGAACEGRCCRPGPGSGPGMAAKGAGDSEPSPPPPPRDHCYNPVSLCCMDMAHRCARLGA